MLCLRLLTQVLLAVLWQWYEHMSANTVTTLCLCNDFAMPQPSDAILLVTTSMQGFVKTEKRATCFLHNQVC